MASLLTKTKIFFKQHNKSNDSYDHNGADVFYIFLILKSPLSLNRGLDCLEVLNGLLDVLEILKVIEKSIKSSHWPV